MQQWTREDLPHWDTIRDADDMHGNGMRSRVIDIALDTIVEHLNKEIVFVVRDHHLPGASRTKDGDWATFGSDNVYDPDMTAIEARTRASKCLSLVAEYESLARAIEHEQDADPVETKAGELWTATRQDGDPDWVGLVRMADSGDGFDRDFASTDVDRFRTLARHLLGQSAHPVG